MWTEITIAVYVYVFVVKKLKDHIKNSNHEIANLKTGGPCWHYIGHLGLTAGLGRIFLSFCLIILRNMSMLNQLPSSRNNYLNHVIDCEKVFEQCKTHQDNYSDKDLKCNLQSAIKMFLHLT